MGQEITQFQAFKNTLQKLEMAPVLPKHIPEEKFKQVVVTAVQKNPKLLDLNRQSLFNACMDCAQDGLIPDGREAALVPYKGTVRYTPMIQGITKKARNSGEIATLDAQVVYANDEFDSWIDEKGAHFKHKKARGDRGEPILTYAYAITKDGAFYFEEIDETQMKAIEKCSPANNSPWKGAFKDEMKRKSAMRRLCKYRLPSSTDIDRMMHRDDDMYDFEYHKEDNSETANIEKEETTKKPKIEDVIDAEIVEEETVKEPEPEPEPQQEEIIPEKTVETGIVDDLKSKSGEKENGQPWTLYGCRINGHYYRTFSKSYNDLFVSSMDKKIPLKIEYEAEGQFRNIKSAELLVDWDKEEENNDVPI